MTENPLRDKDYKALNAALYKSNQVRELVEKAKRAGIPCEQYDGVCDYYDTHLELIKKEYFPGKP